MRRRERLRRQVCWAHLRHALDASVLRLEAIAELLAEQLEVADIHLLDQGFGLAIQIAGPRVLAARDVQNVLGVNKEVVRTALRKQLVRGIREETIVHGDLDAEGRIKVLRLRHERAPEGVRGVTGEVISHHLSDSAVDIASRDKLWVRASIVGNIAPEHGDQSLVRIPQHAEDGLIPKVGLCDLCRPVLAGRVVERATCDF
mmetsp:Transcript_38988/g.123801  ORF Transcript_38988/g.123801 Transcript_38988/m.123801 type:complete len:202 (-) Transcript_38988:620-1225(-)